MRRDTFNRGAVTSRCMSPGSQLRDLLSRDEIVCSPGVHDPLAARVADAVGFEMLSMTGNGTSVSKLGLPDAGLITLPEMASNAERIAETADVPILADADDGYGNAINAGRTVREFARAGVAGVHIEDQSFPKRCGFVEGKRVVPEEEAVGKYRAAAAARDEVDPEFVLVARTDARGVDGGTLEDAIGRANAYRDAGADVAWVQGPRDEREVERVADEVEGPLLYNCSASAPKLALDRLEALGYDVAMYPRMSILPAITAMHETFEAAREDPVEAFERAQERFGDLPFESYDSFAGFDRIAAQEREFLPEE